MIEDFDDMDRDVRDELARYDAWDHAFHEQEQEINEPDE